MAIRKVLEVKVGSEIKLKDLIYTVRRNRISDLDLERNYQMSKLSDHYQGVKHDSYVNVVTEPGTPSLAEQFKEQLKKPSLTEQLKAQVQKGDLTESLRAQVSEPSSLADHGVTFALPRSSVIDGKARMDAQVAKAGVASVQEDIQEIRSVQNDFVYQIDEAHDKIIDLDDRTSDRISDVEQSVEDVSSELSNVVAQANGALANIDGRISKLEQKERAQDMQNELQAQLNAKLASKQAQPKTNSILGGNKMSKLTNSFKGLFGKVEGQFALAATGGIAMRNGLSENYLVYDKATGSITDVQSLVLDFNVPAFRLPVNATDIKVGDIIVNDGSYGYVTKKADGFVRVLFPTKQTEGTVIPTKNLFLQTPFYTVVQTLDIAGQSGFNPALLLAMGDGKKDDILPFLLMSGGLGGGAQAGAIDPTMLMMLGDNVDELLPFLLFQQGGLTQDGFNPLMLLAMSDKGGSKKDSLLPLLLMQGQGGQSGAFNPLMLLAMGDGDIDPMTLMLMSGGLGGQNPFAPAPQAPQAPAGTEGAEAGN